MIDGLKLILTGEEIKSLLEQQAAAHRTQATHWRREAMRPLEEQIEHGRVISEQRCESEAARLEWRADVLTFLRDHLDPSEVYRLGESDLEFAELLPEPPASLEQEDLGPFARRICDSPEIIEVLNPDHPANRGNPEH